MPSVQVNTFNYTTGPATLPDVGTLIYNNCTFSPLYETSVSGAMVEDRARRTVNYMEYTITADGYVTLPINANDISPTMQTLRNLLTAQGGLLVYKGRGCDIVVGPSSGSAAAVRDVAWGPEPRILEFQPLGGGLSAKIRWQVVVRIPEIPKANREVGGLSDLPLLQFNYETSITYGDDGYSTLSVSGSAEIAMTRSPNQANRTLLATVDDIRGILDERVFVGIDLSTFRITRRNISVSRDKRTMEWDIQVEEQPYMGNPANCMIADGSFSFRPVRSGYGLCSWLCTINATYTVQMGAPRRVAWFAFLALLRERMRYSVLGLGTIPGNANPNLDQRVAPWESPSYSAPNDDPTPFWQQLLSNQTQAINPQIVKQRALLFDFSGGDGLYRSSKVTNFSATWRLTTTFDAIIAASGLWRKVPEEDAQEKSVWAMSIAGVSGSHSWQFNKLNAALDVIVDFGGG